ncbi:hypothetical protein AAG570_010288 [Ranatra chinensis]|uniref:Peptidase S9 prolyl oligopeptidase catalytic domain-containing protein n=1 Tax=Ranatra chinensis TaxID=642074 RepID=A0ABD0YM71_9HEMI
MLMVNYRGSIGSGQSSVDFLLGRVGTTDVSDMHQVVCQVIKENTHLDPNKCVLFGGSHGGFLVLHLSGQYPSEFKSCVALNPVVDLPTFSGSDIPDWAVVEAGFDYTPTLELTSEMFEKMRKASPIQYVPQVEAPTLLLLGKKDLRVPCYQGLAYYHALKARNVKTKVLMYDDNHPLSQTMHEADFAINTVLWFLENINHEIE